DADHATVDGSLGAPGAMTFLDLATVGRAGEPNEAIKPRTTKHPIDVVAIGASADGVAALTSVLRALPASFPAPVLIVQHRSPRGQRSLERILAPVSALPVKELSTGEAMQPGTVYIAPPDEHLLVADGHVELSRTAKVKFARPSIDVLFESVARVYG